MSRQARWQGVPDAVHPGPEWYLWPTLLLRAVSFALVTLVLLPVFFAFRASDRLWPGSHRAHRIVRLWARSGLFHCGLRLVLHGEPVKTGGALVANHASWIDILTLHSAFAMHFVAKSEVKSWPGIGWLAKISGTEFIDRRRSAARHQHRALSHRLQQNDALCLFPEGTSTDGLRVLAFKSTLFAALSGNGLDQEFVIRPVSVVYQPRAGLRPDFYGWWGGMGLLGHMGSVLARSRQGRVEIFVHDPVRTRDFGDRKLLARHCEDQVRKGVEQLLAAT